MKEIDQATRIKAIQGAAYLLIYIIVFLSVLVIAGWTLNIGELTRLSPASVQTDPLTAVMFILSGIALWLIKEEKYVRKKKRISQGIAILIFLIGITKLISVLVGFDFYIDHVLFRRQLYDPIAEDITHMAPNTAFNFILLGIAIFFMDKARTRKLYEFLSIVITLISLLNLYGYIYGVQFLIGIATYIPMSLTAAINFLCGALCVLFLRPHKGSMRILIGENPLEVIFLRFLALFLPLLFGWFKLWGEERGLFSTEFGTAILAVLSYSISMLLLGRKSVVQFKLRMVRKKAEMIIKEDAKRLNSILDNSNTIFYIRDLSGKYSKVNNSFEYLYEKSKNELVGKHVNEIFPEDIAQMIINEDNEIIHSRKLMTFEEKIENSRGTFHILTVKFPLIDTKNRVYSVCGISTDITKLKDYERELVEKEKLLNAIIENIGEGVVVADHEGKFLVYNKHAEHLVGKGAEDTPISEWSETYKVYYPDGKTIFPAEHLPLVKAIRGGDTDEEELVIKNPNFPEGRRISITGRPIKMEDGKFTGVIIFRDVTERRKLQEEIFLNEKHLQDILSILGEGIVECDSRGKVINFNEEAEKILGFDAYLTEYTSWRKLFELYFQDEKTKFPWSQHPMSRALLGETTDHVEFFIKPLNEKKPRKLSGSARPIKNSSGDVTSAVFSFRDITDLKDLEQRTNELEKFLKTIIDNIGEGIIVVDSDKRVMLFNKSAEELLGKGEPDVPFEEWTKHYQVYYPDGKTLYPVENLPLVIAIEGGWTDEEELIVKHPDFPEGRRISSTARPIRKSDGTNAAVSILRDVTTKRLLQEEIFQSEKHLQEILSVIGEGIIECEVNGKISILNKAAEELLGIKVLFTPLHEWPKMFHIYHPDDKTEFPWEEFPLNLAIKGKETNNVELMIRSKEMKKPIKISGSGRPIYNDKGKLVSGVFNFRDVTQVRSLEKKSQNLEEKYWNMRKAVKKDGERKEREEKPK